MTSIELCLESILDNEFERDVIDVELYDVDKLLDTVLTQYNSILYNDTVSIIFSDKNIDDNINEYIIKKIEKDNKIVCREFLHEKNLKKKLSKTDYLLYVSVPHFNMYEDENQECDTASFMFLQEYNKNIAGYNDEKMVISADVLCSVEIAKINKGNKVKLGLGMFLFYKAIQSVIELNKYDIMVGHAASVPLLKFYIKYGFQFGLPGLDLIEVIETFEEYKNTNNYDETEIEEEEILYDAVYDYLKELFEDDYSLGAQYLNISEDEIDYLYNAKYDNDIDDEEKERAEYEIDDKLKDLCSTIVNVPESTCFMIFNLNDNSINTMKELVQIKWQEYLATEDFY